MSIAKSSVCTIMGAKAQQMLAEIQAVKNTVQAPINTLNAYIRNMKWTATNDLENIIGKVQSACLHSSDWNKVNNILVTCSVLKKAFPSPAAIVNTLTNEALNELESLMDSIPEFSAAKLFNVVASLLPADLSTFISDFKNLLGCIDTICGTDTSEVANQLSNMLKQSYLNDDGTLDTDAILKDAGVVNPAKIASFKQATQVFTDFNNSVMASKISGITTITSDLKDVNSFVDQAKSKLTGYGSGTFG